PMDGRHTLNPGEGCFFNNPSSNGVLVTFVGEVLQGTLVNNLPAGFSLRASMVPQAGALDTLLGLPAADRDVVYRFLKGQYVAYTYFSGSGWYGPTNAPALNLAVGEAFFINKASSTNWTRSFSVTN